VCHARTLPRVPGELERLFELRLLCRWGLPVGGGVPGLLPPPGSTRGGTSAFGSACTTVCVKRRRTTARLALSVWFCGGYCRRRPAINKERPCFFPTRGPPSVESSSPRARL